jgi:hypothetical protein
VRRDHRQSGRRAQPSERRRAGARIGTLAGAVGAAYTAWLPAASAAQSPAPPTAADTAALVARVTADGARDTTRALLGLGSVADVARRDAQLIGTAAPTRRLFRSPSSEPDAATPAPGANPPAAPEWRAILPQVRALWNGALPYTENEGSLWAGRGANARVRGGVAFRTGRARIVFAPELAYSANRGFDVPPANVPGRSTYASPYYTGLLDRGPAADLPIRYGDRAFVNLDFGQSSMTIESGPVAFGAATEAEWWGPGVRTALALSTAATGSRGRSSAPRAPCARRWARSRRGCSAAPSPSRRSSTRSTRARGARSLARRSRSRPAARRGSRWARRASWSAPAGSAADGLVRALDVFQYWEAGPAHRPGRAAHARRYAPAADARRPARDLLRAAGAARRPASRSTASGAGSTCRARCASSSSLRRRARPTSSACSGCRRPWARRACRARWRGR